MFCFCFVFSDSGPLRLCGSNVVLYQIVNGQCKAKSGAAVGAAFKIIPSTNRIIASVQSLKYNSPAVDALYQESKNFKFSNNIKKQNFVFNKNIIINIENFKHSKDSKFDLNNL